MTNNYIRIFDTTLRDGEQSPGASMTSVEKLEVARALARMGVDVIEAGFPAASPDDLEGVRQIAREVGNAPRSLVSIANEVHRHSTDELRTTSLVEFIETKAPPPIICGLARAHKGDIDRAWEAIQYAARPRIHTFLATSPIHMKHKLQMDPEEVVERAAEMVAYARNYCADVEFSPEDAGRSEPEFLYLVLGEAIKAGATTLNIPDTVGYTTPDEFYRLIDGIMKHTPGLASPGIENVIVSVHCHNDLGLATANTLAGLRAGARQAEVTVNGIGERAGNTSLEEVVMALHTRRPVFGLETGIDTTHITRVSKMVSNYTSIPVQPNKAIVGANAFAHEAGIHQDGMLKHESTYEIMRPETVGLNKSALVLGKHSGRHALKVRLADMGYDLEQAELDTVFERFKALADKKKVVAEADLEALMTDSLYQTREIFTLDGLQVTCGTMGLPTATVRLTGPDGKVHIHASIGTGPVDAVYKAIDHLTHIHGTLLEYSVRSVTEGIDAIGEVSVRVQADNGDVHKRTSPQSGREQSRTFGGHGAETDIIVASAKAYLAAVNKLLVATGRYTENI